MENKRYEYRTPVQIIVDRLQLPSVELPPASRGYIYELSASGCRFESPVLLKIGQELSLSFVLPGGYTIVNAKARVIRTTQDEKEPLGVACQFIDLPEADQYKIREFIVWKEAHRESNA